MTAAARFDRLDALRGVAIMWMALFHFGFDLNHFGLLWTHYNFHRDPLWTTQRTVIVSLFLFCAGLGQAVALQGVAGGPHFTRGFWRRWGQIAGCAALVSAGSALMFPRSWIAFGVLHGVVVMLVLTRLAAPAGRWLAPLALVALLLPWVARHPLFDTPWLQWTGLATRKPVTEDWVPVLPWLGVMLLGLAAGRWLLAHRRGVLAGPVAAPLRPRAVLGRFSLSFYMLHQPVFIGVLLGGRTLGWW